MKLMTLDLIVSEEVKYMIESGLLKPGDKIPSERDLSEKYNVQRLTVRSGLQILEDAGVIYSKPRSGYYVANPPIKKIADDIVSTTSEIQSTNNEFETKIIKFTEKEIDKYLYTEMKLPLGTRLYELKRLRILNGEPISMDYSFIPKYVPPGLEKFNFENESLYAVLEREYNVHLKRSEQNIVVIQSEENYCYDLNLTPQDYVVLQSGIVYDQNGQLVEFSETYSKVGYFEYVTKSK